MLLFVMMDENVLTSLREILLIHNCLLTLHTVFANQYHFLHNHSYCPHIFSFLIFIRGKILKKPPKQKWMLMTSEQQAEGKLVIPGVPLVWNTNQWLAQLLPLSKRPCIVFISRTYSWKLKCHFNLMTNGHWPC